MIGAIVSGTDTMAKSLRLELKEWEQSFAATHQGRKAGREDIKQYPEIARKYKQYDRLRRSSSEQSAPHHPTPSKKRPATISYPDRSSCSPDKRPKHAHPIHPAATHFHDPPSPRHLSPRTIRTSIGPTPQKDGQVLGLFDQLSAASNSQTPSKRKALLSVGGNMAATPSKRPQSTHRKDTEELHHKSPLSGTKSKVLNDLLTPSTRRTTDCLTPASRNAVSKLRLDDTPAFLKRDSQRTDVGKENVLGDEDGISWSPIAMRKMPKAAGRGLSAIVKGLREMEDEGLDEELEMLRDLESECVYRNQDRPKILVNDSQRFDMPLGPDGGLESDEDSVNNAGDGKGRDGKPLKVWKKKGQKRTTRRVLVKPNTAKWEPEPAWKVNGDQDDGIAETQAVRVDRPTDYGCDNNEYEDIEGIQVPTRAANDTKRASANELGKRPGLAKKVQKKISATAHANFRALKIKNKQSKTKGGRFRQKR